MDTQKSKSAVLITVPTTQPVFLLGFHRGGTTFVQRILNCHRDVTVWGENRGVLTLLRQFYETYADSPAQPVEVDSYRRFTEYADQFVPWANPFSATDLIRDIAQFVESIYARGEAEYWGFKEIRHADVADISFLCRLFPTCRILLLVRHPKDNMLSAFLVRWTSARAAPSIDVYVRQFLNRLHVTTTGVPNRRRALAIEYTTSHL